MKTPMLDRFVPIAEGLDHPEGVASGPDGRVYAGGEAGQIYRVEDDTFVQIASTDGFLYGITLDADGNVYGCDFGRAEVVRVTPAGDVTSYSRGTPTRQMRVPNFAAFDDAGNLFVTDSGEWRNDDGLVFRVSPSGETAVWTEEANGFTNGCCLTAGGDGLLVVESTKSRVVRFPILPDGSAGPMEIVVDLHGSLPDGVALADDGTMFVGCYRPDRIWRVPPGGEPEILADDPDGVTFNQPANLAFFGTDLDRVVVSSLGGWALVAADIGVTGLPLRYPSLG
jgi:gluconolactonase